MVTLLPEPISAVTPFAQHNRKETEAAVSQQILILLPRTLPVSKVQKNAKASLIWNEEIVSHFANFDLGNPRRKSVWGFC